MKNKLNQKGQALITVIVIAATAVIVTSSAIIITINNAQTTSSLPIAESVLVGAESGAENAIRILLRNENYTGETLNIGDITVTISVSGTNIKTITSEAANADMKRKIQVIGTYENGMFSPTSWKEIN